MSLNIEQLKSEIHSIANFLGIKKYDVYGSTKEESSASSKNKKPFSLNSASKSSMLIRVWNQNNQVGVTSTSNLTHNGLTDALKLAQSSAEFGSLENTYDFSENCLNENGNIHIQQDYSNTAKMGLLVEKSVQAESKILENSPVFKSVPYNKVSESFSTRFYFNNLGAFKAEDKNISFCYFYPLAQEEGKVAREAGHVSIVNGFQNLDVENCAEKAIIKTKNHLNYKNIKTGKYQVVFSGEAFLDLFNSFSNFINAQNILDKKSLSSIETLGAQIASSFFTLYDSPLHEKNPSKTHFDEEGTLTQNIEIIKNGVLKTFLHSSYTAKKFQTKSTGNANIGAKVTVSPHFLHIITTQSNPNKLDLKTENNVIYIEGVKSLHAGVNPLQGSFSLPFDGFLVNQGNMESIESATVAGDFLTLLKNIIYVGEIEEVTANGISPEIWVNELSITGNAE
jgi:PmbA protein